MNKTMFQLKVSGEETRLKTLLQNVSFKGLSRWRIIKNAYCGMLAAAQQPDGPLGIYVQR